jgi:hypothetical protein
VFHQVSKHQEILRDLEQEDSYDCSPNSDVDLAGHLSGDCWWHQQRLEQGSSHENNVKFHIKFRSFGSLYKASQIPFFRFHESETYKCYLPPQPYVIVGSPQYNLLMKDGTSKACSLKGHNNSKIHPGFWHLLLVL